MNIEGVFGKKNIDRPITDEEWERLDKKMDERAKTAPKEACAN